MIGYKGGKFYEIFVDNTILFLEQIDRNKNTYTSIFDSPILAAYKAVHDQYGTVFTFCLMWETDSACTGEYYVRDRDYAATIRVGWNLSNMTDKFKTEFAANAHWLRFNYHSWNHSTEYALTARNLGNDYSQVRTEVLRFAGSGSWIDFRSKMHSLSATGTQQLQIRAEGVRVLMYSSMHSGYNGYNATIAFKNLIFESGEEYRSDTDILYTMSCARIESITTTIDGLFTGAPMNMGDYLTEFVARTNSAWKQGSKLKYLSFETHEYVYFWPPEVFQGFRDSAQWCITNGYNPAFYNYHITDGLTYNWVSPSFG